jgi:hypothetical protein
MEHMNILQRVEQIKAAGNYTWNSIKETLEKEYSKTFASGEACRSWYRRQKGTHNPTIPVSVPRSFEPILEVPLQASLVIADLHVPFHDEVFITDAVENAKESFYQLEAIFIAGDLFDFAGLSQYPRDSHITRLDTEMQLAGSMLLYLAEQAPVYICSGNHDERWSKRLDSPLSLQRLISAALNGRETKHDIIVTDRDYLFVGDHFIIGHLSTYNKVPGKVAYDIAKKYNRTTLTGHDHLAGVYGDNTSKVLGASIGCAADYTKFWYSERRLNSMPAMKKGYALINGTGDTFSLFDENHKEYFQRVGMSDGVYNCYRSE